MSRAETDAARRRDAELARRFARGQGALIVAVLTVDSTRRQPTILASVYAVASGKLLRRAMVEVGRNDDGIRVAQLAAYLDPSAPSSASGAVVALTQDGYEAAPLEPRLAATADRTQVAASIEAAPASDRGARLPTPTSLRGRNRHWHEWLLGGAGIISASAGTYLVIVDGESRCNGTRPDCGTYDTRAPGWAAVSAGVLAVSSALVLHLSHADGPAVVAMPTGHGVVGAAAWRF